MEKVPMTRQGLDTLEEEFKRLRNEERPAVIKAIAAAREHGDLSENAEYHAARERQSFIEEGWLNLRMSLVAPTSLTCRNCQEPLSDLVPT